MRKWYQIENKADRAEIWIYDEIGEDFWTGGGVTAKRFQKELSDLKASQIDLHINSPGGNVFDGITIYNLLRAFPATVTTYIDGLAASIASVIALAGDQVIMAQNALFMIHNPSGMVYGNASDLRATADVLDKISDSMVATYLSKTTIEESEIIKMMDAETWMNADEAIAAGFVDSVSEEMDLAACSGFVPAMARMGFRRVPDALSERKVLTARELERALRDAGCSQKEAKAIMSGGYRGRDWDDSVTTEPNMDAEGQRDVVHEAPKSLSRNAQLLIRAEKLLTRQ